MSRNIVIYILCNVIFQKTVFFIVTAGRTLNLAQQFFTERIILLSSIFMKIF